MPPNNEQLRDDTFIAMKFNYQRVEFFLEEFVGRHSDSDS